MKCAINCDLGEGLENDNLIMPLINQCNIACGGHAGDERTIQNTIELALKHAVQIGAHPSYPDRLNFGRLTVNPEQKVLANSLIEQIQRVEQIALKNGTEMKHIKFHGALYNDSAKDEGLASFLCKIITKHWPSVALFVPPRSAFSKFSEGLTLIYEGFIDRRYDDEMNLVSRKLPHAVITDPDQAFKQYQLLDKEGMVYTESGLMQELHVQTLCIHGDNPNALSIFKRIHNTR